MNTLSVMKLKSIKKLRISFLSFAILISILMSGCNGNASNLLANIESVYVQDFENNLDNIIGGTRRPFNGSTVIGNFNNDGFDVILENLPKHNHIIVSFDLFIHDSWDGNLEGVGGPDLWRMIVNPSDTTLDRSLTFETSFSNGGCDSQRCLQQAFPKSYPYNNAPRSGATQLIQGLCSYGNLPAGTSLYKIEKSFFHTGGDLIIRFEDTLTQANTSSPKCDESWSMDNLSIWVADYQ